MPPTLDDRYKQVERLIYSTCHKFHRRFGGNIDDIISEANLIFVEHAPRYDPKRKTKFSYYIAKHLWWRLEYQHRKENVRRPKILKRTELTGDMVARSEPVFDVHDWAKDLSEESMFVIQSVLEVPIELRFCLFGKRRRTKDHGFHFRQCVRAYLRELGWARVAIRFAFAEIRSAL